MVKNKAVGASMPCDLTAKEKELQSILINKLPLAVVVVIDDRVVFANDRAAELYGAASPEDLLGLSVIEMHPEDRRGASMKRRDMVMEDGLVAPTMEYDFERPDGNRVTVEVTAYPYVYGGRPAGLIIGQDVTERVRTQAALAESESLLRAVTETTTTGIYVARGEKVLYANRASREIAGLLPGKTGKKGKNWSPFDFVHPDMIKRARERSEARIKGEPVSDRYDIRLKTADGHEKWIDFSARRIEYQGDWAILGTCTDVTDTHEALEELQESRARLRDLTAELAAVEERERRSIARDLHDVIGQNLAMTVSRLKSLAESRPDDWARVAQDLAGQLEQTITDARYLTFEISPPILYDLGLDAAVEWLTEKFSAQHGLDVRFTGDGRNTALDDDQRYLLFRAARELLTNVVKHSGARHVKVELNRKRGSLHLEVSDDGNGFTPVERKTLDGGIGLLSLQERLESYGGKLRIDSGPGRGTRIGIVLPATGQTGSKGVNKNVR